MVQASTLVLALLAQCALASPPTRRWGQQHEEKDQLGAVASESSVCSRVGVDLIKNGGNAADAVSLVSLHTVICYPPSKTNGVDVRRWLARCFAWESLVDISPKILNACF